MTSRITRLAGATALAVAAAWGTHGLARRLRPPQTVVAREDLAARSGGTRRLASVLERLRGTPARADAGRVIAAVPTGRGAAPGPAPLSLPQLSDLDRMVLEEEAGARLHRALTKAVSRRVGDRCSSAQQDGTVIDIRFRAMTTAQGLVASQPLLFVREGAPLSPETQACLERLLETPLEAPLPAAEALTPFEGEARTTLVLAGEDSRESVVAATLTEE